MPSFIVAFLFAAGFATWVYTKLMRTTGNNTRSSAIAAGLIFVFTFFVFWAIMNFINNLTNQ